MTVLNVPVPTYMADEEFNLFGDSVGKFLDEHASPETVAGFREQGIVPRAFWEKAAKAGLLALSTPAEYGGMGGDFRHEVVLMHEIGWRGFEGWDVTLHNAIVAPYIEAYGSEEQKRYWLPRMASGETISAIAMTEPGTGSDLQAVRTTAKRDGNHYLINGQKTFITNGQNADLILLVTKTDPDAGAKGVSLILIDTSDAEGFERGRNLDKMGRDSSDTSELFFNDVRVPTANLLGPIEGQGFFQLMEKLPQERLLLAVQCMASIEFVLKITLDYVKERRAFGKAVIDFQNTQFRLAELKTEATIGRVFVDHCVGLHLEGKLDSATASMAKYWISDLLGKITDECLQFFGGYGFMNEYPITQAYKDARVTRIYGGTNEIMKLLIARTL
ncbi:acyl-CoA dehydrogenase family protein [Sphingomonas colocasiae]|uniref:Acyl-[acyl-carrier-protein] dehydrogenase MbtN n=1 Tax=Sphingomonas colocasiae TaxID=1848973 RepID=A0ABS7PT56_9SPHN|nr:acyl-CoA dehydrogenase family protein [Sphingomonas colocasiae]MBY8824356.1 acyl-CoA dehydrogenase family protein [Sphingomonas colocasiae]